MESERSRKRSRRAIAPTRSSRERDPARSGKKMELPVQKLLHRHAGRTGVQARRDGQCRLRALVRGLQPGRSLHPAPRICAAIAPRRDRARSRPAASPVSGCCGCRSAPPPAGWHRCRPWPTAARPLSARAAMLELRRHHAAGAPPGGPEVDHDGQIAAADHRVEVVVRQFDRVAVEQRAAAVAAHH